jgi:hypothetical protein
MEYTELIFGATLKEDTPIEVIETLRYFIGDIDAQMMRFERQIIVDAYNDDLYGGLSGQKKFNDGDDYYNSIFGELS